MYLDLLQKMRIPYKITRSNYTLDIESSAINAYFMTNVMSDKAFICGALVKKDILASGIEIPEIDRDILKYFDFNIPSIINANEVMYNVDIKSAYATALIANKLISEKTFNFLASLSKTDRLAAVGMLASRKDIFEHDASGECIEHTKQIKDTANWFSYCILEIQKLMEGVRDEIGEDFLFYWVDGIFFKTKENAEKIMQYLAKKGYKSTFEVCTSFKYLEDSAQKMLFYKKQDGTEKRLSLPKTNKDVDKYLISLLKKTQQI